LHDAEEALRGLGILRRGGRKAEQEDGRQRSHHFFRILARLTVAWVTTPVLIHRGRSSLFPSTATESVYFPSGSSRRSPSFPRATSFPAGSNSAYSPAPTVTSWSADISSDAFFTWKYFPLPAAAVRSSCSRQSSSL